MQCLPYSTFINSIYGITPEYPTHPTVLGLGLGSQLGLGLGSGLGLGLGLGLGMCVGYNGEETISVI